MAQPKILIVDNEIEIIQFLGMHLTREGYSIVWTTDSSEALAIIKNENPDLIILDVVMPTLNGIDLCAKIREEFNTPIVFLSCKNEVSDKVLGLSMGGDDYITKPFHISELIARIKTNLKRQYRLETPGAAEEAEILSTDGLQVDLAAHTAQVGGVVLNLTMKEFDLLALLMKSPNRVFTPKQIFEHLWNSYGLEEDYHTVMVHISNLRKKLEPHSRYADAIQTVRGVGYKFVKK